MVGLLEREQREGLCWNEARLGCGLAPSRCLLGAPSTLTHITTSSSMAHSYSPVSSLSPKHTVSLPPALIAKPACPSPGHRSSSNATVVSLLGCCTCLGLLLSIKRPGSFLFLQKALPDYLISVYELPESKTSHCVGSCCICYATCKHYLVPD